MNNLYNNSGSQDKRNIFSRIIKYFSKDSVAIKIIFIIGVSSILLGSWQMLSGIKNSFILSPTVLKDKAAMIENLNRLKDTDGDGLSDYDELYTYGTSPYLEDSDSDGFSDYNEVILGQGTTNTSTQISVGQNQIDVNEALKAGIDSMTLEEFKKQLLSSGYEKEVVDNLTETDFEEMKKELNKSLSDGSGTNTQSSSSSTQAKAPVSADELEALKNVPISEIKQILKDQGVSDEDINKFSDEELKAFYVDALENY